MSPKRTKKYTPEYIASSCLSYSLSLPQNHVAEGFSQWKIPTTPSRIEPTTFVCVCLLNIETNKYFDIIIKI